MDSKLLSLSYEYPPIGGGGAKVVNSLTDDLLARGKSIDLVTMAYRDLPRKESTGNLNIFRVPCMRRNESVCHPHEMIPYLVFALPLVLWKARKNRYVINHTHFIFPDGVLAYLAKKFIRLPYVITAHGSDVPGYNPDRFQFLHKILAPFWKVVARNAEYIICPSAHLAELIHSVDPAVRTKVIPNGIDLAKFDANRPRKRQVLVVTRMVERKGVQYLIEALSGWQCDFEVKIVGDGPYLPELKKRARDIAVDVDFLGYVDNKSSEFRDLFETSEIYVFTSSSENFPIVLLEAMTAGTAIITSNDTGCAEAVGDCAMLVPPMDSTAIRNALQVLIGDPELCRDLGRKGRERVEAMFSTETVTEQYVNLYDEVTSVRGENHKNQKSDDHE
jgi:glycosyltransferase involved in cell wall biosynthesis